MHENCNAIDNAIMGVGKGFASKAGLTGRLKIELFDSLGNLKELREIVNTVTTVGKAHVADQLSSSPGEAAMSHMGIGTGSPSATALGSELDRNALTSRTDSGAVVTYVGNWAAADGTGAITEAGIFNAASAGTMLCSASFAAINKGAADTLQITWTLTIS